MGRRSAVFSDWSESEEEVNADLVIWKRWSSSLGGASWSIEEVAASAVSN